MALLRKITRTLYALSIDVITDSRLSSSNWRGDVRIVSRPTDKVSVGRDADIVVRRSVRSGVVEAGVKAASQTRASAARVLMMAFGPI